MPDVRLGVWTAVLIPRGLTLTAGLGGGVAVAAWLRSTGDPNWSVFLLALSAAVVALLQQTLP